MDRLGTAFNGFRVHAVDGMVGEVVDMLVDEHTWRLSWLVAYSGAWLNYSRLLIHPDLLGRPDMASGECSVNLTKVQISNSPGRDDDEPVSPEMERSLTAYYGLASAIEPSAPVAVSLPQDHHLSSMADLLEYDVQAADGTVGYLRNYVFDDEAWRIRALVVDMPNRWFATPVVVPCEAPAQISGRERRVNIELTCAEVRASALLNRPGPVDLAYRALRHAYRDWKAERLANIVNSKKSQQGRM